LSNHPFLLTKWYLDCVADNGDAAILYSADLHWNALSFHYGSLLTVLDGKVGSASSVRGSAAPTLNDGMIAVQHQSLGVEGTWQALRDPIRRTVFETADGAVDWHCLQPMSKVDLLLPRNTRLQGIGYAEYLTLSVLPWHLPMTSLLWGRYLSQQDAIVWIDWHGSPPYRSVIHNGEEQFAESITESEVTFAGTGGRLELDCGLVLRDGRLGETIFPGISRLAALLPRSMLAVHERKWRSRGVFRTAAGQSSGWAIHEVVKWKD
jgi:hypothetical protein